MPVTLLGRMRCYVWGWMCVVLVGSSAVLSAHDMWIEPMTFAPQPGEIVGLRLRVGQDLLGDPLPRDSSLIDQFIVEDARGRNPVVGRDGGDPAGFVRASAPGALVVGYRSRQSRVEMTAEKFNAYVQEEGLDRVLAERTRRGELGAPVRELFSRCAKSLLFSGAPADTPADRRLGFALELVAERNPYTLRPDQDLPVRLTYENRPLSGVLVVAINRVRPAEKLSARTDADGRVRLPVRAGGFWLVKAVHMIPAPAGSQADWESLWASLTFGPSPAVVASR